MKKNPPNVLYHYTSQEGFIGIVRDKKMWATEISYLNDSEEFRYAVGFTKEAINKLHADSSYRKYQELLDAIQYQLERLGPQLTNTDLLTIYVCSFSERGDLLSQWRGYCPGANGYSLGFNFEILKSLENQQGITLSKCLYSKKDKLAKVSQLLKVVYKRFESQLKDPSLTDRRDDLLTQAAVSFVDDWLKSAPTLKNPTFKEEEEWRLTQYVPLERPNSLHFRPGETLIIPFIEFSLTDENGRFPLQEIIVSPTTHKDLSIASVNRLLSAHNIGNCSAVSSRIPYSIL